MVKKIRITKEERDEVLELQRTASLSMHLMKTSTSCMEYAQKELTERWLDAQTKVEIKVMALTEKHRCLDMVGDDEYIAKGWFVNFGDQALYAVVRKLIDDEPALRNQ